MACAVGRTSISSPEEHWREALENKNEEIDDGEGCNNGHACIDNVMLNACYAETVEEETNRQSNKESSHVIERLAEPPVHQT